MLESWIIWWAVCVAVSTLVGVSRGQSASGFVWGFFLGPIGILVVLFLPNKRREARRLERQAVVDQQTALLRQTLAAQEEQIRLLRTMAGVAEPAAGQVAPAALESTPAESSLDEFVPESLRSLPKKPAPAPFTAPSSITHFS